MPVLFAHLRELPGIERQVHGLLQAPPVLLPEKRHSHAALRRGFLLRRLDVLVEVLCDVRRRKAGAKEGLRQPQRPAL